MTVFSEASFAGQIPESVLRAAERLWRAGYEAYLVGGCVRDMLLGIAPHDFDLCTSALPVQMKQVFAGSHLIETGIRHGTVALRTGGMTVEITAYRSDGAYLDGRHPSGVQFGCTLSEDLARRDFTMNAMAWYPERGLMDPFGGRQDLKSGVLRCVGVPEDRFREDGLRILRAMRFLARFGFEADLATAQAMEHCRGMIAHVSHERIAGEMHGILAGSHAVPVLKTFPSVLSSALPLFDTAEEKALLAGVDALPFTQTDDLAVRAACLLCAVSPARAEEALAYLRVSTLFRQQVVSLVQNSHSAILPAEMPLWLSRLGVDGCAALLRLQSALGQAGLVDPVPEEALREAMDRVLRSGLPLTLQELAVTGDDLMAMGFPRGRALGEALRTLHERVLRGEVSNRKDMLLQAAAALR